MNIDKIREERQLEGVEKWIKARCAGTLFYATGVGKTYTALLAIDRVERTRKPMYLLTVSSAEVATQWIRQLEARYTKEMLKRVIVRTAQQLLLDNLVYEVDVFIVDEVHEYSSEERFRIINGDLVRYKAILALTASADDKNFRKILQFAPIIDTITEAEAKEKGFIAEFVEYNIGLSLTADERVKYEAHSALIAEYMPLFNNSLSLAQFCISGGEDPKTSMYYAGSNWSMGVAYKRGWREGNDEALSPNDIGRTAVRLMKSVRMRKDLLTTCESKVKTTIDIIKKFKNVKMIVFSESTAFADTVYDEVVKTEKAVIYHSNLQTIIRPSPKTGLPIKIGKVRLKREAVEAIRSGKARVVITSKALDKGFDVVDLRMSVTASGTQNPTQYKQRGGRVKRKEINIFDDCTVLLVNLYIKDTQDEKWLKSRQSKIIHSIIDVNSIDEITYTPPANVEYEEDV